MRNIQRTGKNILCLVIVFALVFSFAACGGGSGGSSTADQTYKFRLATLTTQGLPLYDACVYFVDRVSELTDGAVEIEIYPSSLLGDYVDVKGELILGSIDMSWDCPAVEYDIRLSFVDVPFLLTDWEETKYAMVKDGFYRGMIDDIGDNLGLVLLGMSPGGFLGVAGKDLGTRETMFNPDAKKNSMIRIPPTPSGGYIMDALNYNSITIPYSDLYPALQMGVADGWLGGGPDLNYEAFRDVIDYYAAFDVWLEAYLLWMSGKVMNNLPKAYQDALMQAGWEASELAFELHLESAEYYYKMLRDYGIEVIIPTDAEREKLSKRVVDEVWPKMIDIFGQDMYDWLIDNYSQMKTALGRD